MSMDILVWVGAAISVAGLLGLVWCIFRVAKAKRAGLNDDELREAVKRVVPINLGALFMSVIGLMLVILGVFLG
jgi:alkylhydroperoxidase/carboxymuconolactone decarboxylase family protein YurZ